MQYNDLFNSYSRKDSGMVKMLFATLSGQYQNIWGDWEDIPPSAAWWQKICDAITAAANFVVILSRDYISSEVCLNEIREAELPAKKSYLLWPEPLYPSRICHKACAA